MLNLRLQLWWLYMQYLEHTCHVHLSILWPRIDFFGESFLSFFFLSLFEKYVWAFHFCFGAGCPHMIKKSCTRKLSVHDVHKFCVITWGVYFWGHSEWKMLTFSVIVELWVRKVMVILMQQTFCCNKKWHLMVVCNFASTFSAVTFGHVYEWL
jgi:hypothetical protein